MIHFERLDTEEMARMGIAFKSAEEERLFSEIIREEFEVRIGEIISSTLTDKQLKEFDQIDSEKNGKEWLTVNCPEYGKMIAETQMELQREVIRYRGEIQGATIISDDFTDLLIDEIGLSAHSIRTLTRENIVTVGDLLEYGDLSKVPRLGEVHRKEINSKLRALMDSVR